MLASSHQHNLWVCHRKLTIGFVKRSGFTRKEMPDREKSCSWTLLKAGKEAFGFEEIYISPVLKEKKGPGMKRGQIKKMHDESLLSGITETGTGTGTATARSSELGDNIPQKMISIPVQMPLPKISFLDLTILNFLRYLIRDNWTVKQLKAKFLKSGHDSIFLTLLNNEATLNLYENGVNVANEFLSEDEQKILTQQQIERNEFIRKMPKQPQVTTKLDSVFAEAGFDPTHNNDESSLVDNNGGGGNTGADSEF